MINTRDINIYVQDKEKYIKRFISKDKDYEFIFLYTDEDQHFVDIYDNKKHILRAMYSILGTYNIINSIWTWAWIIPYVEKNLTIDSRKIRKYGNELDSAKITSEIEKYIYYCKSPTFFISYKNIDELINLSLYISKGIWIMKRKIDENDHNPGIIELILIKKIIQEKI